MKKYYVKWNEIYKRLGELRITHHDKVWGVPRGGQIIAGLTGYAVDDIEDATIIVDDIIDSGKTEKEYARKYCNLPFFSLFDKRTEEKIKNKWVVFPWEVNDTEKDIRDTIIRQMEYIGEDVSREGLLKTPERIIKSWEHLYSGYNKDPKKLLTVFDSDGYDEIVLLRGIELFSMCEHHMLPFIGKAHVGYIPDKKVIGVSKLARLVEIYARRLQIQERLTKQIAETLVKILQPKGVGVIIEAQHLCMKMRGVEKQNSVMVTSSMLGVFRNDNRAREEFLKLVKGKL